MIKNVTQNSTDYRNNWPVKLYIGGKITKRQIGDFGSGEISYNRLPRKGVFSYQSGYALKYSQIIQWITRILPDCLQPT